MGRYCLVPGCKSQAGHQGIRIHTATSEEQAGQWLAVCNRGGQVNVKNSGVCSLHFRPDDYDRDIKFELLNPDQDPQMNKNRRLKMGAIPSQNIPNRVSKVNMLPSQSQLTYEDVFRDFVQRSLEEERKQNSSPSDGPAPASAGADDATDSVTSGAADGGDEPPRSSGRGRAGGRGRRRRSAEREEADTTAPAAKRPRGRGRGRPGRRPRTVSSSRSAIDSDNSLESASTSRASAEPESEKEEPDTGRRRSARSSARAVDFKHLLDNDSDEEKVDGDLEDGDARGRATGVSERQDSADDESGDDWRPPRNRMGSSDDDSDRKTSGGASRRGRPAGSRGRGGASSGNSNSSSGGGVTSYKIPEDIAAKVNAPRTSSEQGRNSAGLKTGDFLISVEDINLETPPIWRIDGKFLIQKYEPIKGKGQRLYKNMGTYMSWAADTEKFRPVSVRYHQMGRTETIVELLDNPHSSTFNLSKMLSIEETSKYLDNFEIFIQTLVSQALDPNFLVEITQEGDEYFMKNVAIVQEANLTRKNKIMELKSWDESTQEELDSLPVLELVLLRNVPPSECAVCHQTANARLVQIYGRPYDPSTLLIQENVPTPGKRQHNMCSFCAGLADLYNKVQHLTYHLYLRCCEKVTLRKKESADDDTTLILNDILADEKWLSKAFSDVQHIWGDVDQIYAAAKEEQEGGKAASPGKAATSGKAASSTEKTASA
ncbi:uncharacterized protein LOC122364520 isoform X1 [Amphibalanus amphitrite]|uniref:uncharacterized protein LOC122364520 isoform X1 n=1 Tax=Amphibalanus amphitrite TaxID=1232801 RepID=UPI001C92A4AC|nr:uncharacterized protein LOC122364520 isoform X1 [Amphibalanus amphitrite]